MTPPPRVTLGVPVYNAEQYLAETLDSLLAQDYADLEVVVSDNASTDMTRAIVMQYAAQDSRVRLIANPVNLGAAANYNRLVREARGELFKWCGYDDLLAPTYVSRCVDALDQEPRAALAFPRTLIIDAAGRVVQAYDDRLDLRDERPWMRVAQFARRVNLCNACFGLMRREVMLRTGLIRGYVSSDIPFLAEMAAHGPFLQVQQPLFRRRVHAASSRQGRTTLADVAHWFDASRTTAPRAPKLRFMVGTVQALSAAPIPIVDRISVIAAYSAVTAARRSRIRGGRIKAALLGRRITPSELVHQLEPRTT